MSKDLNDYQITKNLIIFFLVVAIVTVGLAYLGIYIQDSDYRKNIEMETEKLLKKNSLNLSIKYYLFRSEVVCDYFSIDDYWRTIDYGSVN